MINTESGVKIVRCFCGMTACTRQYVLLSILIVTLPYTTAISACTSIMIKAADGTVVTARTAEFGFDTEPNILTIPNNKTYTSQFYADLKGRSWKLRYAILGTNFFHYPLVIDGINQKGLAVSALYHSGKTQYAKVTNKTAHKTLNPWEFPTWILAQYSTVGEVEKEIKDVLLSDQPLEEIERPLPLHFVVYDTQGKGLIIEINNEGHLVAQRSYIGILTDAPEYKWHLTNLRNYITVPPLVGSAMTLGFNEYYQKGIKSGLIGVPGDYSSASRFIRALGLLETVEQPTNATEAISQAFNILNHFTIPSGVLTENIKGQNKRDYKTYWTTAIDLKNKRYYFHTSHNRALRMADFTSLDKGEKTLRTIPMRRNEPIATDVNRQAMDFFDGY